MEEPPVFCGAYSEKFEVLSLKYREVVYTYPSVFTNLILIFIVKDEQFFCYTNKFGR
jgi:hypothetical protein